MRYKGSKNRIAKHILPIMLAEAEKQGLKTWVEPFVGGANVIDKVPDSFKRIGYDLNPHTIAALIAIRDMVEELPESFSVEQRNFYRSQPASPLTSWACIVTSFGGDLLGGYAKSVNSKGGQRNPLCEAKNNAKKQSPKLDGVVLECLSYENISFQEPSLIYCDPPYQGTTGYKTGTFDHDKFFNWCRQKKAEGHTVFVSEYNAPDDFEVVWEGEVRLNFAGNRKGPSILAVEKLFKV